MMNAALTNDASRKSEVLRARRLVATFFGTEMDYEEILRKLKFNLENREI